MCQLGSHQITDFAKCIIYCPSLFFNNIPTSFGLASLCNNKSILKECNASENTSCLDSQLLRTKSLASSNLHHLWNFRWPEVSALHLLPKHTRSGFPFPVALLASGRKIFRLLSASSDQAEGDRLHLLDPKWHSTDGWTELWCSPLLRPLMINVTECYWHDWM